MSTSPYDFDTDAVLDLETLGTKPGCSILAIGATSIDSTELFYVTIDPISCMEYGLTPDPATVAWWADQSDEAIKEAFSGKVSLPSALTAFYEWYVEGDVTAVWGNGAGFDMPILEAAYAACGMKAPWQYKTQRCYRTVAALFPSIKAGEFKGVKHTALADAVHEAAHLRELLIQVAGINKLILQQ